MNRIFRIDRMALQRACLPLCIIPEKGRGGRKAKGKSPIPHPQHLNTRIPEHGPDGECIAGFTVFGRIWRNAGA
jgi:hypothetical protein